MNFRTDGTQDILTQNTANVLYNKNISVTQLRLYVIIKDNLNENHICSMTNQELGDLLGVKKDAISKNLQKLIKENLVVAIRNNYSQDNIKRILKINNQ